MKRFSIYLVLFLTAACVRPAATQMTTGGAPMDGLATGQPSFSSGGAWQPARGTTFQVQFEGDLDLSVEAEVYDIDMFDSDADTVAALHALGRKAVCYISVGSWENWRPDADQFPEEVIGNAYDGRPGEKWLDIRRVDLLTPIMRARLDLCAAKGFDGVEPDNIEIFDNDSGFPISYVEQLEYATWLANEAHARGLAIGLKNAPDMAADVQPYFDFAVTEDCFEYGWCEMLSPFLEAGKPVFAIEYTDTDVDFEAACRQADQLGLSMLLKNRDLDAFLFSCP
jgi:hypothetical protein